MVGNICCSINMGSFNCGSSFINKSNELWDALFYLLFIQGTYIFVSIIAFDIRDLKIDDPKLKTIPQQLGVIRSKLLGSNLLILLILITLYKFGFNTLFLLVHFYVSLHY